MKLTATAQDEKSGIIKVSLLDESGVELHLRFESYDELKTYAFEAPPLDLDMKARKVLQAVLESSIPLEDLMAKEGTDYTIEEAKVTEAGK